MNFCNKELNMKKLIIIILILVGGFFWYAQAQYGYSPLMFAASGENSGLVKILLKFGSDPNTKDEDGWTPLIIATRQSNNPEIIETLLANGANVNAKKKDGRTALMLAVAARYTDNPEIVEILLKNNADVNVKDEDGYTPLMLAADVGDAKLITKLIDMGADVNAKDKEGWTPLFIAARQNKNLDVIKTLIVRGAKIQDGNRLLQLLDQNENIEKNQAFRDLRNKIYNKFNGKD